MNGQTASVSHSKHGDDADGQKTKGKAVNRSAPKGPPLSTGKLSDENVVKILKESFSNLAQSMYAGFSNLGQMFQAQNKELRDTNDEEMSPSDVDSRDSDVSDSEAAPAKRRKTDDTTDSILLQLGKSYNAADN